MTDLSKLSLVQLGNRYAESLSLNHERADSVRAEFRRRDTREAALVRAAREAATNWANDLHDRNRLSAALAAYPENVNG